MVSTLVGDYFFVLLADVENIEKINDLLQNMKHNITEV
jgi:hypothetical protein